ncbi:hypothetical protein ACRAWD_04095 [Caulobacter segnis]
MATEEKTERRCWRSDLSDLSTQDPHRKYSAEASTHRNILIGRAPARRRSGASSRPSLAEVARQAVDRAHPGAG